MKLLLINSTANTGSTGRIAEEIGKCAVSQDYETWFAYGRKAVESQMKLIRIGDKTDLFYHVFKSRFFDKHGFASTNATRKFISKIDRINPDIINIHNLHGYYLNVEVLFDYLKSTNIPVVWTLHDCWPFTGHCAFFERAGCYKWLKQCHDCPNKRGYPGSLWLDKSRTNYLKKKWIFRGLKNLVIIVPSKWLADQLKSSFLSDYPVHVIPNGIDLNHFKIIENYSIRTKYSLNEYKLILGVANKWNERKGLEDFVALSYVLKPNERIILVGIDSRLAAGLPSNIIPIKQTQDISELAAIYSTADVFINPTLADNFPTTNIEAIACGTPVITYKTGGSPESIDESTGIVIEKGNIPDMRKAVNQVLAREKDYYRSVCRFRAQKFYDKDHQFNRYLELFAETIQNRK